MGTPLGAHATPGDYSGLYHNPVTSATQTQIDNDPRIQAALQRLAAAPQGTYTGRLWQDVQDALAQSHITIPQGYHVDGTGHLASDSNFLTQALPIFLAGLGPAAFGAATGGTAAGAGTGAGSGAGASGSPLGTLLPAATPEQLTAAAAGAVPGATAEETAAALEGWLPSTATAGTGLGTLPPGLAPSMTADDWAAALELPSHIPGALLTDAGQPLGTKLPEGFKSGSNLLANTPDAPTPSLLEQILKLSSPTGNKLLDTLLGAGLNILGNALAPLPYQKRQSFRGTSADPIEMLTGAKNAIQGLQPQIQSLIDTPPINEGRRNMVPGLTDLPATESAAVKPPARTAFNPTPTEQGLGLTQQQSAAIALLTANPNQSMQEGMLPSTQSRSPFNNGTVATAPMSSSSGFWNPTARPYQFGTV